VVILFFRLVLWLNYEPFTLDNLINTIKDGIIHDCYDRVDYFFQYALCAIIILFNLALGIIIYAMLELKQT
jgi:hypothetical protein